MALVVTSEKWVYSPPRVRLFLAHWYFCSARKMASTGSSATNSSTGPISPFSTTPIITTKKFNWKNYRSWSNSIEMWFVGQGYYDHLEKDVNEVCVENRAQWQKHDCKLCTIL